MKKTYYSPPNHLPIYQFSHLYKVPAAHRSYPTNRETKPVAFN